MTDTQSLGCDCISTLLIDLDLLFPTTASRLKSHLGHKKLIFYCCKRSFVLSFLLKYALAQAQVIKVFYRYKFKSLIHLGQF